MLQSHNQPARPIQLPKLLHVAMESLHVTVKTEIYHHKISKALIIDTRNNYLPFIIKEKSEDISFYQIYKLLLP